MISKCDMARKYTSLLGTKKIPENPEQGIILELRKFYCKKCYTNITIFQSTLEHQYLLLLRSTFVLLIDSLQEDAGWIDEEANQTVACYRYYRYIYVLRERCI